MHAADGGMSRKTAHSPSVVTENFLSQQGLFSSVSQQTFYVATRLGAGVAIVFPVATHRPGLRAHKISASRATGWSRAGATEEFRHDREFFVATDLILFFVFIGKSLS